MEREYIAHHTCRFGAWAPHSFDAADEALGRLFETTDRTPKMDDLLQKHSKHSITLTEVQELSKCSMPAGLDYEELEGLSELGQRDCPRAKNILE